MKQLTKAGTFSSACSVLQVHATRLQPVFYRCLSVCCPGLPGVIPIYDRAIDGVDGDMKEQADDVNELNIIKIRGYGVFRETALQ